MGKLTAISIRLALCLCVAGSLKAENPEEPEPAGEILVAVPKTQPRHVPKVYTNDDLTVSSIHRTDAPTASAQPQAAAKPAAPAATATSAPASPTALEKGPGEMNVVYQS